MLFRAMSNLGVCYEHGQGVERDLDQALAWYRKGAEAGNGAAMTYLGVGYEQGQGVERDLDQALAWYRKGAEAGDGVAAEAVRRMFSARAARSGRAGPKSSSVD